MSDCICEKDTENLEEKMELELTENQMNCRINCWNETWRVTRPLGSAKANNRVLEES